MVDDQEEQRNDQPEPTEHDRVRMECWDKALYAFATGYIFQERARVLGRRLSALNFGGIVVPVTVGGVVLTYGLGLRGLQAFVYVAGAFGLVQAICSAVAIALNWRERYAYSTESTWSNMQLSSRFKRLARNPPRDLGEFRQELRVVDAENDAREQYDYQKNITDEENRMGHRAGLRQFERQCPTCEEVPQSLEPTTCSACGDFKRRWI